MNLSQILAAAEAERRNKRDPELSAKMDRATAELDASGLVERSLKVGDKAPNFSLSNALGNSVSLSDELDTGPVILSFYRGGWCPYCNLELQYLQSFLNDFKLAGASLLAISPEPPDTSLSTKEKNALTFEVLSDIDNKVARAFGLVFRLPAYLESMYDGKLSTEAYDLPIPATYLVNQEGTILYAFAKADYTKRADPEAILDALKKL